MRHHVQGENSKAAALNVNEKYKSKLFHVSTAQQVLPHRVFTLSMWHRERTIGKGERIRMKETCTKLTSKSTDVKHKYREH